MKSVATILLCLGAVAWGQVEFYVTPTAINGVRVAPEPCKNGYFHPPREGNVCVFAYESLRQRKYSGLIDLPNVTIPTNIKYCDQVSGKDAGKQDCVMHGGQSFMFCQMGEHYETDNSKPGISFFGCVKNSK